MNAKVPTRCQQDWGGFGRVLPTSSLVPVTDDSGFGSAGHRWIVGRDRRGSASGGFSVGGSTPLKSWTGTVLASAPSAPPPPPPIGGSPVPGKRGPKGPVDSVDGGADARPVRLSRSCGLSPCSSPSSQQNSLSRGGGRRKAVESPRFDRRGPVRAMCPVRTENAPEAVFRPFCGGLAGATVTEPTNERIFEGSHRSCA